MTKLVYFARIREQIGIGEEDVSLPAGLVTVRDVARWLAGRGAGYAAAFADTADLRAAVDLEFAGLGAPIGNAREIAFFPPVTGG